MTKEQELGYKWCNEYSIEFLKKDYLLQDETLDQRVKVIANKLEEYVQEKGIGDKFVQYMKNGWISLATPIWTNFGTDRGLPISCYGSHIIDDSNSILDTLSEVAYMSKCGGGTAAYFGNLRPRGALIKGGLNGASGGPVHFMELFDSAISVFSQGATRRGSFAAYLDIEHPDIMEFLEIRGIGSKLQNIHFAVCIGDKWLQEMKDGDKNKRKIWAKVLKARNDNGEPYLFFRDNVNNGAPDVYKDKDLLITHSQLCTEIALYTDEFYTFVCDLSSANARYYREWKNTDLIRIIVFLLDAAMEEFIKKASKLPKLAKAVKFAKEQRALGLGILGYHNLLQSEMIPFESMKAKQLNIELFKKIQKDALAASKELAKKFGEPELLKGYGRRNVTLTAPAPTTSSAFILEQESPGIEPNDSNCYIKDLAKGKFTIYNKELKKLLAEKGIDNEDIWDKIKKNAGSVQGVDFLTEEEQEVFKTFSEISPMEIIIQAAQRQKYICQSQSLNLRINPKTPTKDYNALILKAHELGVKTLYYHLNTNASQDFVRDILTCKSCEG